ncbi:MAG TPA: integrase arm-type DNA-binding domain-containing protein, partial [Methyloradius sp.]
MLSVSTVNNAKPKEKSYKISDEKNLYLLVSKTGKYWRFDYRFLGKRKTLALGIYPDVSLANAREKRDSARKLLANDVDPNEFKKSNNALRILNSENSFEMVAREWIASHMANKAISHREKVLRRFEIYIFPWIGSKPITEITTPEFLTVIKRIEKLGILETAHRALQTSGQVFRYAVQTGRATRDITLDLKGALPATVTIHMATFTDPKDVAELLNAIDSFNGTFTVQCALKIAPLVFVRPSELRMAKWADIDLESGEWRYIVSKTKTDHLVPLPHQAVSLLKELFAVSGHREYVFQGGHSPLR